MPADRLTADCIWNSFLSSGKRHLILTGTRGIGKTTLLSGLFPEKCPGITTFAQPGKAVFLQDNLSGATVQVAEFNPDLIGPENRMVLHGDSFESFGVPILDRCAECDSPWITIDEIGYLEAQCSAYHNALRNLLSKKQVAMVVRKQKIPFLQELCDREDVFVVDLDEPFGKIGCVIMASGFGNRFGGNKLMADFYGEPLICRVLDATENIFSQRIVVTRYADVQKLCEARGVQTVIHNLPCRSDTIKSGLEIMKDIDRCMFATADQPLLRYETVKSLALASRNEPENIWRTICGDIPGSPVVFPEWAFGELMNLREEQGGAVVIKKHPGHLRMVNVQDINELKDVDRPDDLQELLDLFIKENLKA